MKSSYTVSICVGLSMIIAESIIAGNETQPFDDNRCNENPALGNHNALMI